MPTPLEILNKHWGYDAFRPLQEEIIQSVIEEKDTLALLPTGGGKSICFQVPGLYFEGLTIVISPLIALMKDQVERLNQLGIAATYVNSSMPFYQVDTKLQGAMDGDYKFLYLAPERLQSEMFKLRLPKMDVSLLVVDEAHCISQWGYDFRPSYLQIAELREAKPDVPIIAVTASATNEVRADIMEKLEMRDPAVFTKSFRRDNLRYFVLEEENVTQRTIDIVKRTQGTGIIYARTRRTTEHLSNYLIGQGISAAAYHGGLKTSERSRIQQSWLDDKTRIIVATNAFGMGIDKPNVRFVVHYHLPFDLESYYQEAGRGGRDGKTALAIAFRSPIDLKEMERWNADKYPSWEQLKSHYEALCRFYNVPQGGKFDELLDFDMSDLSVTTQLPALKLYNSMKVLHNEGLIFLNEESDDFGYIQFYARPQDLIIYKEQHPQIAELIDFILRTLGGDSYTKDQRFHPERWARILDLPPVELHYQLQRLVQHRIILYTPPSNQPTLRFLQPRRNLNKKELNWDKYDFLRKQSDVRLEKLMDYINHETVCRSLLIQRYFGEKSNSPCGKCDVCVGRNRKSGSNSELQQVQKAIVDYVRNNPVSYRDTLMKVKIGTPALREKALRYLLDKGAVIAEDTGDLRLKD